MNHSAIYAARLENKVKAHNLLGQLVNEWQPKIKQALLPWVGQKVSLVTGGKPVKLKLDLSALEMPDAFDSFIRVSFDQYSAKVHYRTCVTHPVGGTNYAETCVYLGDMEGANLKDLHYEFTPYPTDYTVDKIITARLAFKAAEEKLSAARSALHPFGEHENC
jgi:hypothetical protein